MNTVAELINELESKGVRFYPHTGALRVDAPQGMLTDHLRAILMECKPEIVAFLQAGEVAAGDESYDAKRFELEGDIVHLFNERASILAYEGKIPKVEVERMAIIETQRPQYRRWQALGRGELAGPGRISFHRVGCSY